MEFVEDITLAMEYQFSSRIYPNRIISKDNAPEWASEVQKLMMKKYGWNKGLIIELNISS